MARLNVTINMGECMRIVIPNKTGNRLNDLVAVLLSSESKLDEFLNNFNITVDRHDNSLLIPNIQIYYVQEVSETKYPILDYEGQTFTSEDDIEYQIVLEYKDVKDNKYKLRDFLVLISNQKDCENKSKILEVFSESTYIYFMQQIEVYNYPTDFYKMLFKILQDEETYQKFIEFDKNSSEFGYSQKEYLIAISRLMNSETLLGEKYVESKKEIFAFNLVTPKMSERYFLLRKMINIDVDVLREPFGEEGTESSYERIQRAIDGKEDFENEYRKVSGWQIDKGIVDFVKIGMEPDYSPEDKVIHIYTRLCLLFNYEGYYKLKPYSTAYNKEAMESINTEDVKSIICSDISKILTKIINDESIGIFSKDEGVEARCCTPEDKNDHEAVAVIFRNSQTKVILDPTSNLDSKDGLNDLVRAKMGLSLGGIRIIADRNNIWKKKIGDISQKIYRLEGRLKASDDDIPNLISAYKSLTTSWPKEQRFSGKIRYFFEKCRENGIYDTDVIMLFFKLVKYFSVEKFVIIGEQINSDEIRRNLLIKLENGYAIVDSIDLTYRLITEFEKEQMYNIGKIFDESKAYTLRSK